MNKNERKAMIEEYGRGFDFLEAALAEIPRKTWEFKPAPKVWSVHELLVHMKDSEAMGVVRLHKLIAEPGSLIMYYEEDKWSEALNYQAQNLEDALQTFKLMRRTAHALLMTLSDSVFTHTVEHQAGLSYPEYGDAYTIDKWLNIYTRHVRDHIEQLKQIHQAWREQNP